MKRGNALGTSGRVPEFVAPMLAVPDRGVLPDDPRYAYEFKWDGYRALIRVAPDGTTVLTSRNNNDFTPRFPELSGTLTSALDGRPAILDGEIVALDERGRPTFALLHNHDSRSRTIAYFVFDILQLGEDPLIDLPYDQRRAILESIEPADRNVVAISPSYSHTELAATGTSPQDLLKVAKESGLEGLVIKDKNSLYRPGRRSPDWLKHPLIQTLEVIIGGWRPGQGNRAGSIGALLLGGHDRDTGELLYLGDVGTGVTHTTLTDLQNKLGPLERASSPFANEVPRERSRGAHWVDPTLVGEVVYRQITPGERRLRHTAWRGWRPDKTPSDVLIPQTPGHNPKSR